MDKNSITIYDLSAPVLTEAAQAAMEMVAEMSVVLNPDDIITEAKDTLSLDDFGDMEFMSRLTLLCEEWSQDKTINNLGLLGLRGKLVTFAKNRLLIQDLLTRHPEIHDVKIKAPIIVAGLPRSGTTHLLNLLAADSRLRSLPLWESYEPVPTPGEEAGETGQDPRYERCDAQWQAMQQISPLMAAMHPMNPEHIHEELELMGPDFASYNFEWLSTSPRWRDYYFSTDQTSHYEYMKTVLKILTWQDGDVSGAQTRWVLKCPQHLEQLRVLKEVFPDAIIPITHRDPVSVIQSAATMVAYGRRAIRDSIDVPEIGAYWSDRIYRLLEACVRDRAQIPAAQSIDILFHEFMADAFKTIEVIYEKAGLDLTDEARSELQNFIDNHPRGKYGQIEYHLKRDFGIEPAELREKFKFYFDAFPVKVEA